MFRFFVLFGLLCTLTGAGFCAGVQELPVPKANNAGTAGQNTLNMTVNKNAEIEAAVREVLSSRLPGAELTSFREVEKDGMKVYECSVLYKGYNINMTVNPATGAISANAKNENQTETLGSTEDLSNKKLRAMAAQVNKTLEEKMPGAKIERIKYNKKDNTIEGRVMNNGFGFKFRVNAETGEIIEMTRVF